MQHININQSHIQTAVNISKEKEEKEVYDEIISKMMSYLLFIVRNYDRINLENEDECLFTIFKYLSEYKMENPIYFLKVSKMINILISLHVWE